MSTKFSWDNTDVKMKLEELNRGKIKPSDVIAYLSEQYNREFARMTIVAS